MTSKEKDQLKQLYEKQDYRAFFELKGELTRKQIKEDGEKFDFLYPSLDDPKFNYKIATRQEFYDTQYVGKVEPVEEASDKACSAEFELAPHQAFVRNFMSFQTPYNGLLLYHGLGSGKTCSAISVAEEVRVYMKQMGIEKKIIIVASPNVQDNFRLQLFDERKLKQTDGFWNIRSCVGNKFLRQINPMNVQGMTRDKVILFVNKIIREAYEFIGYIEFANDISKIKKEDIRKDENIDPKVLEERITRKIRKAYDDRLIIIDEAHEIRLTPDNTDKRVANELRDVVKYTDNLRLLLLSATPMFNSYKEVLWLVNLLLLNDKRETVSARDVFDEDGKFKTDSKGREIGRELLERKATGYVSFVRGENPYTFPFKVWPSMFSPSNSITKKSYPKDLLNKDKTIPNEIQHLDIYVSSVGSYQNKVYDYLVRQLMTQKKDDLILSDTKKLVGYINLQRPLEALNMVYPSEEFDEQLSKQNPKELINTKELVGKNGLKRVMKFKNRDDKNFFRSFEYKNERYKDLFSQKEIGKYSAKIKSITDAIIGSKGIVLVYSQFIDGGLVPVALALEEIGFSRYDDKQSLFKKSPTPLIDSQTFEEAKKGMPFKKARYVMITGDKALSPDNLREFKACTNQDNKDGNEVKVILLSQAGGQGLDFANIRQVHILEPWYNMNRLEQVIGRAVRNCSHKNLPFKERNVQIFLHGSLLPNKNEEAVDMYVYRFAEEKAVKIGEVSRVLKQIAVDCLLNTEQQNFTASNMKQKVAIEVSTGKKISSFEVGDKPYTFSCDYLPSCEYKCKPVSQIKKNDISSDTYNKAFIQANDDRILQRLRDLFKERHIYSKERLISEIQVIRQYPISQIDSALTKLVDDKNELVSDTFGRLGRVVNLDKLYLFQPLELTNHRQTLYNRRVPIQYKRSHLKFSELPVDSEKMVKKEEIEETNKMIETMEENFNKAFTQNIIGRGEEDWYIFASNVIENLQKEGNKLTVLKKIITNHIIDNLKFDELHNLLNYLENVKDNSDFEKRLQKEIAERIMREGRDEAILWVKLGEAALLVKDKDKWVEGRSEDWNIFNDLIESKRVTSKDVNTTFGFIDDFKNEDMVFKVKQMNKKRNKGARCDQAGKKAAITVLNQIVDEPIYTVDNLKNINQKQICVMQELLLRLFEIEEKDGMVWFVGPGQAALSKVDRLE